MRNLENTLKVVREWIKKAESDLLTAGHMVKMGKKSPADTVCFHAQQCAEKYLKALLVWKGVEFSRTHNIAALVVAAKIKFTPPLAKLDQDRLTEYATVTRYPGDYEPISLTEARRAVTLARRVKKGVIRILPKNGPGSGPKDALLI
ncbi:MAG: HEPN domain-containing protein [Nitrospinae bacterium]|nr:HEPN domain-containing protein [Nitrospinota bacterium]